jgi:hypothetical protein
MYRTLASVSFAFMWPSPGRKKPADLAITRPYLFGEQVERARKLVAKHPLDYKRVVLR